jgi:hypothetical protein
MAVELRVLAIPSPLMACGMAPVVPLLTRRMGVTGDWLGAPPVAAAKRATVPIALLRLV